MKVRIDEDEWYPVYSVSDVGVEIEVPSGVVAVWNEAERKFRECQQEMEEECRRQSKNK